MLHPGLRQVEQALNRPALVFEFQLDDGHRVHAGHRAADVQRHFHQASVGRGQQAMLARDVRGMQLHEHGAGLGGQGGLQGQAGLAACMQTQVDGGHGGGCAWHRHLVFEPVHGA